MANDLKEQTGSFLVKSMGKIQKIFKIRREFWRNSEKFRETSPQWLRRQDYSILS